MKAIKCTIEIETSHKELDEIWQVLEFILIRKDTFPAETDGEKSYKERIVELARKYTDQIEAVRDNY